MEQAIREILSNALFWTFLLGMYVGHRMGTSSTRNFRLFESNTAKK